MDRVFACVCAVAIVLGVGCGREAPPSHVESEQGTVNHAKTPKELFDLYVKLYHAFDADVVELYADEAVIRNTRIYPDGQKRTKTMPAAEYKRLIRKTMPLAKARGDTSSYREVTYTEEDSGTRIEAIRHSNLKSYDSPISILLRQTDSGQWLIFEEISQSQP